MPLERLETVLKGHLETLTTEGRCKGKEHVVREIIPAAHGRGPRYLLGGHDKPFLKMNSNNYLGLSLHPKVIHAEEEAARKYGVGPGAVRFISGTYQPHVDLERTLAAFHDSEEAVLFSSAYAAIVSTIVSLVTPDTALISDELNHNCIINAGKLARPKEKYVYKHLDLADLEAKLELASQSCQRALVVTDGVFSMRGVHAPLADIAKLVQRFDERFTENAVLVVDDSHGVGAFGMAGRGTEEVTQSRCDVLVGTLGKAFGVNGGYVVGSATFTTYLRETAPMYIYSNPITPSEAAAANKVLEIVQASEGQRLLGHLRELLSKFRTGLDELGFETLPGVHPVVPLMVRDTSKTIALVKQLFDGGILATGLRYPVVPRGDESIRFQLNADQTLGDVKEVLKVLGSSA
jgi:glycine C-acetyltransferase